MSWARSANAARSRRTTTCCASTKSGCGPAAGGTASCSSNAALSRTHRLASDSSSDVVQMMRATNEPTREQIEDERRRARRVRLIVDFTCALIAQTRPLRRDAEQMVQAARARILEL